MIKTKVNIDTRQLNRIIPNRIENTYSLDFNPLTVCSIGYVSTLNINAPNHPFIKGDKLVIYGVKGKSISIFSNSIKILNSDNKIKITLNHGLVNTDADMFIKCTGYITGVFKVYLTIYENEIVNKNYFYIDKTNVDVTFPNINIQFLDINGIPIQTFTSDLTPNETKKTFTVSNVSRDIISINLIEPINITVTNFGNNSVWIGKVHVTNVEYTPNNYVIPFNKTFTNVIGIKLISTEFPYTEHLIKTEHSNKNNVLYWKILGSNKQYQYCLLKNKCNYDDLKNILESNINVDNLKCSVNISEKTNHCSISFYKINNFCNNITFVFSEGLHKLIIKHVDHGLKTGLEIEINGSLSVATVPDRIINRKHIISKVLNQHSYMVVLPPFNHLSEESTSNGGNEITIKYPVKAIINNDKYDSIGKILGYDMKDYDYNMINTLPFQNIKNSYIKMYFKINGHKELFSKIQLLEPFNNYIYNSFIQISNATFNPPLKTLTEWSVSFTDLNDEPYDFDNDNHSYTLEIYENLVTSI